MADTAEQARVREALRARGEALAPRVQPGGSARRSTPRTAASRPIRPRSSTGPRRASSTASRARRSTTGTRTTPPPTQPPAEDVGPLGGRRSSRTQPPTPYERAQRVVYREAGKQWRAVPRVLVVEWIAALVIVATKPYEPAEPGKATEATIPQLIAVSFVFFLLAALASMSPKAQRIANLFGGLVDLALLLRNHGSVIGTITTVAKYQAPQAPNIAPSPAPGESPSTATSPGPGGILPTPTGQPSFAQQIISGWRGAAPDTATASGNAQPTPQPAPGG